MSSRKWYVFVLNNSTLLLSFTLNYDFVVAVLYSFPGPLLPYFPRSFTLLPSFLLSFLPCLSLPPSFPSLLSSFLPPFYPFCLPSLCAPPSSPLFPISFCPLKVILSRRFACLCSEIILGILILGDPGQKGRGHPGSPRMGGSSTIQ